MRKMAKASTTNIKNSGVMLNFIITTIHEGNTPIGVTVTPSPRTRRFNRSSRFVITSTFFESKILYMCECVNISLYLFSEFTKSKNLKYKSS